MTALDVDTTVDALVGLDWKVGTPCEGTGHFDVHVPKGDARWVQRGTCPRCQRSHAMKVCEGGRQYRLLCDRISCVACKEAAPRDEWGFTFTPIGGDL